ncbi:uncharacterized protein isoform X2 [Leptinotarsa decemlineata]|uniref:uncharacterized protein isoform X2 n=1 Tax=Leptinotarsa decemlineata TaxID=7539 RepID=UPI003D30BC54
MHWLVMLAIIFAGTSAADAYIGEKDLKSPMKEAAREWHDKCIVITGAAEKDIHKIGHGDFNADEKTKRYHTCRFIIPGGITPQMKFNIEVFEKYIPKSMKNTIKDYEECFEQANIEEKFPVDKIWSMLKCVYNRDPPNMIVF